MLYLYTENKTLLHTSHSNDVSALYYLAEMCAFGSDRLVAASTAYSIQKRTKKTCQRNWRGETNSISGEVTVLGTTKSIFEYECWFLLEAVRRTIQAAGSVFAVRNRWRSFSRESVPQAAAEQHGCFAVQVA